MAANRYTLRGGEPALAIIVGEPGSGSPVATQPNAGGTEICSVDVA